MWYVSARRKAILVVILSFISLYPGVRPCRASEGPDKSKTVAGEVVSVDGIVFTRNDGKGQGGKARTVQPGDYVYAEDVINTSSNGRIKILLKDKSIVDLGPSALFKVDHFDSKA